MILFHVMYNCIVFERFEFLQMNQEPMDFLTWQERFDSEAACLEAIARHRWRDGFVCPSCGHDQAWVLQRRCTRSCRRCGHQTSPTAGTIFENTRLPMTKWFAAIYLMTTDKGGFVGGTAAQDDRRLLAFGATHAGQAASGDGGSGCRLLRCGNWSRSMTALSVAGTREANAAGVPRPSDRCCWPWGRPRRARPPS